MDIHPSTEYLGKSQTLNNRQSEVIIIRKRKNTILLRLDDKEFQQLNRAVSKTGLTREAYLRSLVMEKTPKELPSMDLVSVLRNLQQINNNMNQIAMKANSMRFVDTAAYWANVDILKQMIQELLEVMYG